MSMFTRIRRRRMGMRMSCAEVGAVLQQYLDGSLDETTSPFVEAHLEMCRKCGLDAAIYADIKEALAQRGELPEDSVRRLREFGERLARGEIPVDHEE